MDAGRFIHNLVSMDWTALESIAIAVGTAIAIAGVVFGAGRMANSIESMAKAIKEFGEKIESLFAIQNEHEKKIAVHEERINDHERRMIKIER